MAATRSPIFGLPIPAPGQGSSEVVVAEWMIRMQALHMGADGFYSAPPSSPYLGQVVIVADTPDEDTDFEDHANKVGIWYGSSWRFVPDVTIAGANIEMGEDQEGMSIWVRGSFNCRMVWNGAEWVPE